MICYFLILTIPYKLSLQAIEKRFSKSFLNVSIVPFKPFRVVKKKSFSQAIWAKPSAVTIE